jgi:Domain of unknown function (DUF4185)/Domain of unknown function (DUF1906)/Putative peptidoglycan binding domain/N-acetylmuramoyl-L-alanine amidase
VRLIDFSARTISPDCIKSAGYDGVIAYVSRSRPGTDFRAKPITREYADQLRAAGLHIVSNYQYGKAGGSAPSDFTRGFDGGVADAQTAMRLHADAGGPDCAPIFFSVDEDISIDRWNAVGVNWFRGINSVLGVDRTGIYGHSRVCAWAIQDGVVGRSTTPDRRWVWQTRAWSSGEREPAAVLYQDVIDTPSNPGPLVDDARVDENQVLADDFGQWDLFRPPYPGSALVRGATGADVIAVQDRLNGVTDAGLLVDGEFATLTGRAVSAFQTGHGLVADAQVGPQTWTALFAGDGAGPLRPTNGQAAGAAVAPPDGDADRFPLPVGRYWGPTGGPAQAWSNLAGNEPQSSKDGLRRWQEAIGVAASGVYDNATKEAAARLQALRGWRPVTGDVGPREWDEVIRNGWRPPAPAQPTQPATIKSPIGYQIGWHAGPGYYESHGAYLRIYLHTTENQDWVTTAESVADYQTRTRNDSDAGSYHYVIDDDHIINTVATKNTAWGVGHDNVVSVHIAMVATSGTIGCWTGQQPLVANPNVERHPKTREQWLAHDKMLDMVAYTIAAVAKQYDIPIEWLDIEAVGANHRGVSSHHNYSYGSVLLYGHQDSDHWDVPPTFPHDVVLGAARTYTGIIDGPDRFSLLAAGHAWGPLDGPQESWSNTYGGEPQSSKDGLTRWQQSVGITPSGIYDNETKRAASQLQRLKGWPVTGQVSEREWNEVISSGWRPAAPEAAVAPPVINPGGAVGAPIKLRDVTGPGGLTDQFGLAATDLGVMARTPLGRIIAVFGDTFRDPHVPSADWRAPVALFSDTKNLDGGIVWSQAAGRDPHYAQQLWPYSHVPYSTVLPSDILTLGNAMYLQVMGNLGHFGNVAFLEIWKSIDDGHTWFRPGPQCWDIGRHGGLAQLWTWDVGDDGFVYVISTGFQRDKGIILRRVRAEDSQIINWDAYQGWGVGPNGQWGWGNEPTPVLRGPGFDQFGEMCLRRIQGQWVFVAFIDGAPGRIDVRVFADFDNTNLYTAPVISPIHGCPWGQEGPGAVAQLYGPSIVPGSRLDGGFHILLSQWNTDTGWPYHVMQFKIPLPAVPGTPPGLAADTSVPAGPKRRSGPAAKPTGRAGSRSRSRAASTVADQPVSGRNSTRTR